MDIKLWEARYRSREREKEDFDATPAGLLVETVKHVPPGRALDLACGTGRNALWLAEHGWAVTAVDGSQAAIDVLQQRASARGLSIETRVADLEAGQYSIEPSTWDLVTICLLPAKRSSGTCKVRSCSGGTCSDDCAHRGAGGRADQYPIEARRASRILSGMGSPSQLRREATRFRSPAFGSGNRRMAPHALRSYGGEEIQCYGHSLQADSGEGSQHVVTRHGRYNWGECLQLVFQRPEGESPCQSMNIFAATGASDTKKS